MVSLVFFGSSEYSVIILEKLLKLPDFSLSLVVSKIDKPVGRDQIITPNPVAKFAQDHHLPLLQLEEFDKNFKLKIKSYAAQLGLCVAFGPPFFDQELIDSFPYKIINIHPSPLPKYRGATPGPWQIINGETTSSVTFFQIDLLPDHGPIITQIPFTISPTDTTASFYHQAFSLAANRLHSVLISYISAPLSLTPQDHSQKTYFPKLSKDLAKIDWSWPADKIDRFIRALTPWPIAWTLVKNQHGDILKMKVLSTTFNFQLGTLELNNVQIEGKKPSFWSEIKDYYTIVK